MPKMNSAKTIQETLQTVPVGEHAMIDGVPVIRLGMDAWEVCSVGGVPVGTADAVYLVLAFCAIRQGIDRQRNEFKSRYGG